MDLVNHLTLFQGVSHTLQQRPASEMAKATIPFLAFLLIAFFPG